MEWFEFSQNNSGGRFVFSLEKGIGPSVWIKASNARDANYYATEYLDIYFNGVEEDRDCECCGDRWDSVKKYDARAIPTFNENSFNWENAIFLHDFSTKTFVTVTCENLKDSISQGLISIVPWETEKEASVVDRLVKSTLK